MSKTLTLIYQKQEFKDFSFIKIPNSIAGEKIEFDFMMRNDTFYNIQNLKLITNMDETCYSLKMSKSISKYATEKMKITLNTKALFESKNPALYNAETQKHQLVFSLEYEKTRNFE